jgi:hypothetical protein
MQGMKLPVYGQDGSETGLQFTNNAAWVLMDVLRRSGLVNAELDAQLRRGAPAIAMSRSIRRTFTEMQPPFRDFSAT